MDKRTLRPILFFACGTALCVAAVAPWRATLPVPDDNAYFYASLLARHGAARVPIPVVLALHRRPAPRVATAEDPGPPVHFTVTADNQLAPEKPPGYPWWLALLRLLKLVRVANVVVFVIVFPAAFLLWRGADEPRLGYWVSALFMLTPLAGVYIYRTYMPTFMDGALPLLALALFINVARGGRAATVKAFACGAVLGILILIRVTNAPFTAAFGIAFAAAARGDMRKALKRLCVFAVPVAAALAALALYNDALFGSPLRSGYYVRFRTFNFNALTTVWKEKPVVVTPARFRTGETPPGAELPRPDVYVINCEAREGWQAERLFIAKYITPYSGRARLRGHWALSAPLGAPAVAPTVRARIQVVAGRKVLWESETGPPSRWREIGVSYDASAGEELTVVATVSGEGKEGAVVYVTPFDVKATGRRFLLTTWARPWFGLRGTVGRNLVGMYPFVLLAMPLVVLAPFGLARARREMPGGSFWLAAFIIGWTFAFYLQSTIYTPMAVRYYAPALGPLALWAAYGLEGAPRFTRVLVVAALATLTVASLFYALAFYGALDLPWLAEPGKLAFFGG